jgi:hypothetical protein
MAMRCASLHATQIFRVCAREGVIPKSFDCGDGPGESRSRSSWRLLPLRGSRMSVSSSPSRQCTTASRCARQRVSRAATVDPAGLIRRCALRRDEPTTRRLPNWFYSFSFAGAFFAGGFLPWALTTLGLSIFFAPAGRAETSNGKIGPSSRVFSKICFT